MILIVVSQENVPKSWCTPSYEQLLAFDSPALSESSFDWEVPSRDLEIAESESASALIETNVEPGSSTRTQEDSLSTARSCGSQTLDVAYSSLSALEDPLHAYAAEGEDCGGFIGSAHCGLGPNHFMYQHPSTMPLPATQNGTISLQMCVPAYPASSVSFTDVDSGSCDALAAEDDVEARSESESENVDEDDIAPSPRRPTVPLPTRRKERKTPTTPAHSIAGPSRLPMEASFTFNMAPQPARDEDKDDEDKDADYVCEESTKRRRASTRANTGARAAKRAKAKAPARATTRTRRTTSAGAVACKDPDCTHTCETANGIYRHYKAVHLQARQSCPACGHKFLNARKSSLKRHLSKACPGPKRLEWLESL
ncbi:hypothetical protein C8R44DRAFT_873669 [Mycena epipterygia]|nr:hypothetical protein C8R44DRAFT_873669 [Mycena epipterygia]